MIFLLHSLKSAPPRIRRRWRLRSPRQPFEKLRERAKASVSFGAYFHARCVLDFVLDAKLFYYAFSFSCCVIGLTHSPYWFCVGLLDLFRMNEDLQDVAIALGTNARQIVFTFLFALLWGEASAAPRSHLSQKNQRESPKTYFPYCSQQRCSQGAVAGDGIVPWPRLDGRPCPARGAADAEIHAYDHRH